MSYTKRKWKMGNGEIFCAASSGSISPYYKQICSFVDNGTEECKANAKLIAAAPDLLEAIKGLIYGIKMNIQFDTPDEQHKYNEALRNAKAAIEKAV